MQHGDELCNLQTMDLSCGFSSYLADVTYQKIIKIINTEQLLCSVFTYDTMYVIAMCGVHISLPGLLLAMLRLMVMCIVHTNISLILMFIDLLTYQMNFELDCLNAEPEIMN